MFFILLQRAIAAIADFHYRRTGDWVIRAINYMTEKGLKKMVADRESEEKWRAHIFELANQSLLPGSKSVSYHRVL